MYFAFPYSFNFSYLVLAFDATVGDGECDVGDGATKEADLL